MQSRIVGLAPAFSLFPNLNTPHKTFTFHQILVLIITFTAYASFHASRKPPSIVKSVLGPPSLNSSSIDNGWAPFNGTQGTKRLDDSSFAIGFLEAWRLPGVAPYAFCLFFSKLVAYTFLYWLPYYLRHTAVAGVNLSHKTAGILSTVFDVGGVLGGISAGFISDKIKARALTSITFLALSIPALIMYRVYGSVSMFINIVLMFISGLLVNGPYALITTAVAADLGTQDSIKGNGRALATVTAIIDGTGSVGAALGPLLAGYISSRGWNSVFFMLIVSIFFAGLFLVRLAKSEINTMRSGELIASSVP
ncbi:Major facilitator superfamily protein [Arabidopsis thaliana]|uniref:Major facilitator superfamily protein n=1 Tax=Arabidopsis thaliana TaxID=3702 RepID=F4IUB7_ARATH|nr:Major facilitator superfamily protein [Arabidopsis thaliana]AAT06424.1 At2g13100 [Arabidopsis thaliana]AEC06217.1 Major facilitator superfamily protein [Arabidopsis thaliana]|eukprot:NP_001154514.1 Major facilitator superfamily protein [Arabidopsis thaliana]